MLTRLRANVTYANVTATLALVLSLAGTATAASSLIASKQVRDNSLTGADVRNGSLSGVDMRDRSLTGSDIKPESLGSAQVGILGPSDIGVGSVGGSHIAAGALGGSHLAHGSLGGAHIGGGSLEASHLAPTAKVQLPLLAIDRVLIGIGNQSRAVEQVGPITLVAPANACTGNGLTLQLTTTVDDVTLDGDSDFDTGETSPLVFSGLETRLVTATTPAGDSFSIVVQGGLVANQCSISGIVVQGGRTPSAGIIVQGG